MGIRELASVTGLMMVPLAKGIASMHGRGSIALGEKYSNMPF